MDAGGEISFTGTLNGKAYRDQRTVQAVEHEKHVQYGHWSKLSRPADVPENRTINSLSLEGTNEGTRLSVRQQHFHSEAAYKHANFFWGIALADLKNLLER